MVLFWLYNVPAYLFGSVNICNKSFQFTKLNRTTKQTNKHQTNKQTNLLLHYATIFVFQIPPSYKTFYVWLRNNKILIDIEKVAILYIGQKFLNLATVSELHNIEMSIQSTRSTLIFNIWIYIRGLLENEYWLADTEAPTILNCPSD